MPDTARGEGSTDPGCPHGIVAIDYTNHRGERRTRRVLPIDLVFESTGWHPDPQWILHAYDIEKGATRSFAMRAVHSWEPVEFPRPEG